MAPPIRFVFDYISPFAYLAWKQVPAVAARHGSDVVPHPALFAAMLNQHGHKGPAEIPPKREYIFKQCFRAAHRLGVPLVPPPGHPFNPLLSLRVSALPDFEPDERRRVVGAFFDATWGTGAGVDTPERVRSVLEALGLDGAALIEAATAPESKARLAALTEDAIARGAFGVPTLLVGDELFWGVDALVDVDAFLAGEDPLGEADLERWRQLPAAAHRTPRAPRS
jgi:2-hydroxychromene-2-carboxylate isomerase